MALVRNAVHKFLCKVNSKSAQLARFNAFRKVGVSLCKRIKFNSRILKGHRNLSLGQLFANNFNVAAVFVSVMADVDKNLFYSQVNFIGLIRRNVLRRERSDKVRDSLQFRVVGGDHKAFLGIGWQTRIAGRAKTVGAAFRFLADFVQFKRKNRDVVGLVRAVRKTLHFFVHKLDGFF